MIGIGAVTTGDGTTGDALLTMVVYGGFQAFAALVVRSEQREAAARAELATTNVELRATTADPVVADRGAVPDRPRAPRRRRPSAMRRSR